MGFRDSILAISPGFLLGPVGTAVQWAEGLVLDALVDWAIEGVKASMPGVGTPDALHLIGRDVQIDRGPNETNDHYASRCQGAIDSHRVRGSGPELLRQLAAWFSPSVETPLRLVSNGAVWHEIDLSTLAVTKTVVGSNWTWDAFAGSRWWRGWVIVDASAGPWTADVWDEVGTWDDGGTWGSDATLEEVAQIRSIVDKWKPANISCVNVIITFDPTLFLRTDTSPPNPNGNGEDATWRASLNAEFWGAIN